MDKSGALVLVIIRRLIIGSVASVHVVTGAVMQFVERLWNEQSLMMFKQEFSSGDLI